MTWIVGVLAFVAGWLASTGIAIAEHDHRRGDFCDRCRRNGLL